MGTSSNRRLYLPFQKRLNDWVHENTTWKIFIHSCGSIYKLIPDFIEAGFDILNPVQCSAADMDPVQLKKTYGEDIVFWGGGVDTQKTIAFGTPREVHEEVRQRIATFNENGGFVFIEDDPNDCIIFEPGKCRGYSSGGRFVIEFVFTPTFYYPSDILQSIVIEI